MRFKKKKIPPHPAPIQYLCFEEIEDSEDVQHVATITAYYGRVLVSVYYPLTTNKVAEILEEMRRLENEPRTD
jgi:hypothetical protein